MWLNTETGELNVYFANAWATVGGDGGITSVYDVMTSSTGYFDLPTGNTAQRPGAPDNGVIRFNSETARVEYYDSVAAAWMAVTSTSTATAMSVEYLVVAGGGGGGARFGGGGGAGGFRTGTSTVNFTSTYIVTIGSGGSGSTDAAGGGRGSSGSNSIFSTITSTGGGGGGRGSPATSPTAGTTNTGGGGGGGRGFGGPGGAAGGSGIVIVRYLGAPRGSGGTIVQNGGYTYHTFLASSTFTA